MRFAPIATKFPHFLHGGDYNPEQWLNTPGILDEDMRLARLAHVYTMSVGIFSWVSLEPQEGQYDFAWLDEVMYRLAENNMVAVLATPSGARPAWLSAKYPEVMRVDANRVRDLHGGRHNHCYTSLTYREKTQAITSKLAKRYHDHPGQLSCLARSFKVKTTRDSFVIVTAGDCSWCRHSAIFSVAKKSRIIGEISWSRGGPCWL